MNDTDTLTRLPGTWPALAMDYAEAGKRPDTTARIVIYSVHLITLRTYMSLVRAGGSDRRSSRKRRGYAQIRRLEGDD
jgi:hypothetical protein